MILLDRYLLNNFVKAWLVCFISLVSLYVVIDSFNHFDDLLEASRYLQKSLTETMLVYYSYQLVLIFDRLCSVILLLAAAFTIAWMQRQNELVPLLAAGVPMKRVLRPLYIGTLGFLFLQTVNREVIMPQISHHLEHSANDPTGQKIKMVSGGYDSTGILLEGVKAIPKEQVVAGLSCTVPSPLGGTMYHIVAKEARFVPAGTLLPDGSIRTFSGWLLSNTTPDEIPKDGLGGVLFPLNTGQTLVKIEQMDFRRMTRNRAWYQYASLGDILSEMDASGTRQLPALATQLHQRLAAPLVTLISITLGLGIILRDPGKNVFLNTGLCLGLSAAIFMTTIAGKYMGEREFISAAFAGWLPIIIYGPLAYTLRDAMQS